ncbi:MAG: sigma 54-interacting transcriptional regulator [Planctomycetota bacterium]|nr:sigma 54-interacting transcriptional regulator [Planctomycetota bacterium]
MGRILVIDDEPSTRVLFKSRLEDLGHRVTLAANGAEGLMAARSNEFDLFLVDIALGSGVDGFEVCRRLKAVPQTNGVPVVLISGQSTTREDLHRGYNAGCESFLMKGNMTLLEDVLRAMLRIKSLKDDLAVQNYLLERQNRRLQEEMRHRPAGEEESMAPGERRGPERPVGLMLVGHDGLVMHADRGARDLFGAGLEGRSLGVLAPSRGLEAFVRDARIESRVGFRLDLPARAGRANRSLLVSVTPTMPRGGSDLSGLKAVAFHDVARSGSSSDAGFSMASSNYDLPLVEAARRIYRTSSIVGSSLPVIQCREALERALHGTGSVLLSGPEGAGKTYYARTLHFGGERSGRFIHLDVESVSQKALATELFGKAKTKGLVHAADQGTLFLSNVEALPAEIQASLLQLVERGELKTDTGIERLGLRLVASSRRPLDELDRAGSLSLDFLALFGPHRIEIAPLKERPEDIGPLAREMAASISSGGVLLTPQDIASLEKHDWPRNVRELEDCVEILCAAALGDESGLGSLPEVLRERGHSAANQERIPVGSGHGELQPMPRVEATGSAAGAADEPVSLDLYERLALERALEESEGDKLAAARLLKVGKSTLYRKLKRHGLS